MTDLNRRDLLAGAVAMGAEGCGLDTEGADDCGRDTEGVDACGRDTEGSDAGALLTATCGVFSLRVSPSDKAPIAP